MGKGIGVRTPLFRLSLCQCAMKTDFEFAKHGIFPTLIHMSLSHHAGGREIDATALHEDVQELVSNHSHNAVDSHKGSVLCLKTPGVKYVF